MEWLCIISVLLIFAPFVFYFGKYGLFYSVDIQYAKFIYPNDEEKLKKIFKRIIRYDRKFSIHLPTINIADEKKKDKFSYKIFKNLEIEASPYKIDKNLNIHRFIVESINGSSIDKMVFKEFMEIVKFSNSLNVNVKLTKKLIRREKILTSFIFALGFLGIYLLFIYFKITQ